MRRAAVLSLVLTAALLGSCQAERTLRITSDPPGALVRLDGESIGTTPLRHEFLYYGVRTLTLRLEGYCTYSERIDLAAPWYARFPLDIVSEVLIPVGWKDRRRLHVTLQPGEAAEAPPALRSVLERASAVRQAGPDGPAELPPARPRPLPSEEEPEPPAGGEGGSR
ncbi:MAG: PEGA domain-containing protein [Planctomycetota bacterium]